MSTDSNQELQSFYQFIEHELGAGTSALSPEEALETWRMQHPSPRQYTDDVQAIREALEDMKAGDTGVPLQAFREEFRRRHNLSH